MRRRALLVLAAVFFCASAQALQTETLLLQAQTVTPKGGKITAPRSVIVVSGRLMVKFAAGLSSATISGLAASQGARVTGSIPAIGWTLIHLASGTSVASGLTAFRALPGVLRAAPDHFYRAVKVPNDPLFSEQTHLSQIDMPAAWEFDTGGTNLVTIAMIDTGIQFDHPDLASKLVSSGSITSQFFDPDNDGAQSADTTGPACQHGTETAGVAAAETNNGVGVAGVSWGAQLISLRVFNAADCNADCSDTGAHNGCGADDFAMAKAIQYAAIDLQGQPGVGQVVINMSLGSPYGAAGEPATPPTCQAGDVDDPGGVATAIAVSTGQGVPIAIAAGNDGGSFIDMPANCAGTGPSNGVMPVGAVDQSGNIAYFSDSGPELAANGVVAPGEGIVTTDLTSNVDGGYGSGLAGTSFSAPQVAGLMALLYSAKPSLTPAQVQADIRGGAQSVGASGNSQGTGLINGFRVMKLGVQGTLANFAGDEKAIVFPNPFKPSQVGVATVTVPLSLQGGSTTIKIYTVAGQFVRELTGLTWDGTNTDGNPVASGTYLFEVSTNQGHTTGRLALIR